MKIGDESLCVSQEEQGELWVWHSNGNPSIIVYTRLTSHGMKDAGKI